MRRVASAVAFLVATLFLGSTTWAGFDSEDSSFLPISGIDESSSSILSYPLPGESPVDGSMTLYGSQESLQASVLATIAATDTANTSVLMAHDFTNSIGVPLTSYTLNLSSPDPFTISSPTVQPPDWQATLSSSDGAAVQQGSDWVEQITYQGGTTVAADGSFEFGYTVAVSGGTSYPLTESMSGISVVPEPSTLGLLLAGFSFAAALVVKRRTASRLS